MKNNFSIELKVIVAAAAIMLALATAVVVRQVFEAEREEVKFVYNSTHFEEQYSVNNYDIFLEM